MEIKYLHRNLAEAVVGGWDEIFNKRYYADKVIYHLLKSNKKWGARDRRFIAATIYEGVRWKRLYNELAEIKHKFTPKNLWKFLGVYLILNDFELPDWEEFKGISNKKIFNKYQKISNNRSLIASIPDWLDELGSAELGEAQWERELEALNEQAPVVIRTNTLKISREDLQKQFLKEGIETEILKDYPDALLLTNRANVFRTYAFKKGLFEMQDASSQMVARYMNVKPGMRVVDTCAGAGGKTLHLASLMENKGQLIALDIHKHKLEELKKRAKRDGVHNVQIRPINSTKILKKLKNTADRVLIDAPCSGLGVLRRNPDSKWKLNKDFIENIKQTQKEILDKYSNIVKDGGQLVYATCSILPSENEQQVAHFLKNHKEFKLVSEQKVSPANSGYDGFYMALLEKK